MTGNQPTPHLRLSDFLRRNQSAIINEWTEFARTRSPASDGMSRLALQDHIVDILKFVADDLESEQTPSEQMDKSRGLPTRTDHFAAARPRSMLHSVSPTAST